MDEYKVKITPHANVQMLEIFSYINDTLKEPVAALRFLDEIEKIFFLFAICPIE